MKDRQPSMEELQKQREKMVQFQIKARGVSDPKVLQAMLRVPRHEFVPATYRDDAYEDFPLPIGYGQTISQPYIVAYMTEALHLKGGEKVLEIGTGSGYQAAVLAEIAGQVYSIEIVEPLCREAAQRLQQLGYANVSVRCGDGYAGWPEAAPFDAIILTAAPEEIPQPLVEQLGEGGRMILPLGRFSQNLVLLTKQEGKVNKRNLLPVRFVPMTGKAEDKQERK
ncbi:MAG: protein-L-isoaspartate(D-aspartate) O-methyltransferase [candidate division KSB1 bacterium]|nr:protein-L-isoaspartate(D-aspartate) O-methyltransferase [candidate division KSB1 bacterium]